LKFGRVAGAEGKQPRASQREKDVITDLVSSKLREASTFCMNGFSILEAVPERCTLSPEQYRWISFAKTIVGIKVITTVVTITLFIVVIILVFYHETLRVWNTCKELIGVGPQ
jgi:hypothetical protein